MILNYWHAQNMDDHSCYDVIAKTKKEAQAQIDARSHTEFGPIEKRTIVYKDAFDLLEQATGEGGGRGTGSTKNE